jgi:alanine dehydrogenase
MVPAGVRGLVEDGHSVVVETSAGEGSGIPDDEYRQAGATVVGTAAEVFSGAELIVKVKEPLAEECGRLREEQILFTYLHLAPVRDLTARLLSSGVTGIAYETIEGPDDSLPLLTPMSEIAGRMAIQVGASYLEKTHGGAGILLSGVPGVSPASVVIIGGGIVGTNAAKTAVGFGARVTILERSAPRMRYLDDIFGGRVATLMSNRYTLDDSAAGADLLVGAVLIHGASAPKLVTRETLSSMRRGSVIVDVSVDQGGCVETIRPTTHSEPTYYVDGVLHYGVANMPGAVPRTSTFALTNVTFPYVLRLARLGLREAVLADPGLRSGVNVHRGHVTHQAVADSQDLESVPIEDLI